MTISLPNISQVLDRLGDLPAMPSQVAAVLQVTDDPGATMDDLNRVVERDPSLTAKILKVSNSPYYGMRQFVGTLKLALVILGVREIRNIILGVAVIDVFGNDSSIRLIEQHYWNHSNIVGALARCLVIRLRINALGEAFVAGLLHDIGKVVMARQMPEEYIKVMGEVGNDIETLSEVERRVFGFSHAEAGAALSAKWNFPATLTDAIRSHHPGGLPLAQAKDTHLAAVVRIADRIARHNFENDPSTLDTVSDREAWALLEDTTSPLPSPERYAFYQSTMKDILAHPLT